MSEQLSAEERDIRDLTLAILHFYGYTDADIAEAESVHPGRVCDEDCFDEDGRTIHPAAYDELCGTASTVVQVIAPWLTARLAFRDARMAAVEARTEAAFAGIRCALVHGQPEGVSKAVSCANCQSWAASIAMPFFRETSSEDPRTHGLNHAPLLNGALFDPGFCAGCDGERTLRAALHPDPSEAGA